jgi:excisionase family DNA binding protein
MAFSVKEAADILSVSKITIYRLLERGLLRSSGALRRKIIPKVEVERFLKETTRTLD